ncbi:restriction endonuclease subunit S [Ruminococcus sp. YE282]|uniref:restriction endonuclease subunit S n=1 Tax=Ruminococcus sp. YE282 TaxID=3158780 RepID=UPI00088730C9|nr:type I restriction enzyme, S subunit [Ruminococcus bromii]
MNKTPAVRFKGSTEEWEHRKLGELVRLNGRIGFRGYTQNDIITKDEGGILTFSPTNIINNQLILNVKNTYITQEKYDESPEIKIRNDDILFVKTGSTLGKSALVTGLTEPASINPQIVVMRTKPELRRYLSAQLTSVFIQKQVTVEKIGGAVPTLTETKIKNFDVFIPVDSKESTSIGDCFSNIDSLITFHQRKYEKLKNIKKSMLYKMFPQNGSKVPEIRFAGFTDEWEQRKLGELADIVGGGTPNTSNPEYWNGNIDWYAPAEISEQIFVSSSIKRITNQGYDNSSAKLLPVGTVLFTSRAGIGKTAILCKEGCTNQGFQSIVPHEKLLDTYFIFSRTEELKRYGEIMGAGSTFVEVSGKQMSSMELMIPKTIEEQKKIGAFFSRIDNLITLHQRKLEKLKQLKQAMLHKMFV